MNAPRLTVLGISHRTAPVEVRERFAFAPSDVVPFLRSIRAAGVEEAVLLSTCNRTELYLRGSPGAPGVRRAEALLLERGGGDPAAAASFYRRSGEEAVRHLFRVAAGLDSMVLGEAEVQGQVREAYEVAASAEPPMAGRILHRAFQGALAVGGRVRSETLVGEGAASVASVGVELARKVFGSLRGRTILLLGAGSTAELVAQSLARDGVRELAIVNRTAERGEDLARRLGGRARAWPELSATLRTADIVVSSTAAPHPVLTRARMRDVFPEGPRHPLLVIDLSIPRDVEAEVGDEPNVFLYNVDDLQKTVGENLGRRREAVPAAEALVEEQVREFAAWYASLDVVPLIRSLRGRAESVRARELERLLQRLDLSDTEREHLEEFSRRLLNKLLHDPTARLREGAANGRAAGLVEAIRFLYDLAPPHPERAEDDEDHGE